MNVYDQRNLHLNNMERQGAVTVFQFSPLIKARGENRHNDQEEDLVLEVDDIVVLGKFAPDSVTIDLRILVNEGFPDDGRFSIGFPTYDPVDNTINGVIPIVEDLRMRDAYAQIVLPMPTDGNVNPDLTAYTGDRAGIWGGTQIAIQLTEGVMDGTGQMTLLASHSYYGNKSTGGYIK